MTVEDSSNSSRKLPDRILTRWTLTVLCLQDGCLLSTLLPLRHQPESSSEGRQTGWLLDYLKGRQDAGIQQCTHTIETSGKWKEAGYVWRNKELSMILPPYEAKLWIRKPFKVFRAEKDAVGAGCLKRENKDRHNITREHSDSRSNPGAHDTRLYPAPPASLQTSLHCPVLASPGCCLDAHVYIIVISSLHVHHFAFKSNVKQNWFPNLSSSFALYCKPLNLISGYHHTINYIHLKMDFSKGSFLTLYISTWPKSMILITALHTWPSAC